MINTDSDKQKTHTKEENSVSPDIKASRRRVLALVLTAAMTALSVVFTRLLVISTEIVRIEFGFLPIAIVGHLFGPVYSGFGYLVADVLGQFVFPTGSAGINPMISLCKFLSGVWMGIGFYKGKNSLLRTALVFSVLNVCFDFAGMASIFVVWFQYPIAEAVTLRAVNAGITLPLRITSYYCLMNALKTPLSGLQKRYGLSKTDSFQTYANSFQAVTVPGLSRISALLDAFGHPEDSLKCIHVAGTNGKGSTCAFIACGLEDAGYKVGKYISPNLIKVNERISVNGNDISDRDMQRLLEKIERHSDKIKKKTGMAPTQFEIWTCAAFLYFAEQKCDYVVLEVGLGGEFDATNVIKTNEIAVITRLGMDHMQLLGDSIEKIAEAKCGILKEHTKTCALVTVEQEPAAMEVIRRACERCGITVHTVSPTPLTIEGHSEIFSSDAMTLKAGIPGFHQIENAALAAKVLTLLAIPEDAVRSGIARAVNPARFEILRTSPVLIYDGGHNENGITALTASLKRYFPGEKKNVVFACMKDKEIEASLTLLSEDTEAFFFTTVKNNPRALDADALTAKAETYGIHGTAFPEIGDAVEASLATGRLTLVCGSLYLYKDFREYYDKKENENAFY